MLPLLSGQAGNCSHGPCAPLLVHLPRGDIFTLKGKSTHFPCGWLSLKRPILQGGRNGQEKTGLSKRVESIASDENE